MSRTTPTRQQTTTRRKPGDVVNAWTLVKLMEDGPSSQLRRWLIACECGWQARRYEYDLTDSRTKSCTSCGRIKAKEKAAE
jgi:hypothetical protein